MAQIFPNPDETIWRFSAGQRVGKKEFGSDWIVRLSIQDRSLLSEYGLGAPPQPGTLHFFEYDPFEWLGENEIDRQDTERARMRFWQRVRQREQVCQGLSSRGFTGKKFPRADFEQSFAEAYNVEPSREHGSIAGANQHRFEDGGSTMEWDVFISHASEDKENFARPLAERLHKEGLRVWFDEFALTIGDSLRRSIDQGLAKSRYGVVVISPDFLKKEWPQKELDGLVSREIEGVKVILPVWHNIGATEIRTYSPMLADRLAATSSNGLDRVTGQLLEAMRRGQPRVGQDAATAPPQQTNSPTEHRHYASELQRRRVADILDHKGAAAIMDGGALVMHIVPISAIGDVATDAFENISKSPEKFSPIGRGAARDYRISYDGLVVGSNSEGLSKPQRAYVSVSRSGTIEAVQSSLANSRDNFIVLPELQASIINSAYVYARSLASFSVLPPFAVCVSLLNTQGKILLQDFVPRGALIVDLPCNKLDRNSFNFGQAIFEKLPPNYNEAAKTLRPILTHLANAAGLHSSPYFDAAGNYTLADKL